MVNTQDRVIKLEQRFKVVIVGFVAMFLVCIALVCLMLFKPVESATSPGTCLPIDKGGTGCDDVGLRNFLNVADGANVNVQPDWNQTNTNTDNFIKNKPTIQTLKRVSVDLSGQTIPADNGASIAPYAMFSYPAGVSYGNFISALVYNNGSSSRIRFCGFSVDGIYLCNPTSTAFTFPSSNAYLIILYWE